MYLYVLQSKGVARPDDKRQKSSLLVRNFTVLSVKIAFAECGELLSGWPQDDECSLLFLIVFWSLMRSKVVFAVVVVNA